MIKKLNLKIKKKPASIWKRVVAYLIDIFLINLVVAVPFGGYFSKQKNVLDFVLGSTADENLLLISVVIVILTLIYFVYLEWKHGQTLGKMFMNIYVESLNGKLTLQQVILRNITKPFSVVLLVDVIYMFFKRGHQRLFEVFSRTQVIENGVVIK